MATNKNNRTKKEKEIKTEVSNSNPVTVSKNETVTKAKVKDEPTITIEKLLGYFIEIDTKVGWRYSIGKINLNAFKESSKRQKITKDMKIKNIVAGIKINRLFISNEKGENITSKFFKNYKPTIVHVWNNPKSITAEPKIAALSSLLSDAVSNHDFIKSIENATKETIEIIYNLFNELDVQTDIQEVKFRIIKRLYTNQTNIE